MWLKLLNLESGSRAILIMGYVISLIALFGMEQTSSWCSNKYSSSCDIWFTSSIDAVSQGAELSVMWHSPFILAIIEALLPFYL